VLVNGTEGVEQGRGVKSEEGTHDTGNFTFIQQEANDKQKQNTSQCTITVITTSNQCMMTFNQNMTYDLSQTPV
jgi:hypothetical protein